MQQTTIRDQFVPLDERADPQNAYAAHEPKSVTDLHSSDDDPYQEIIDPLGQIQVEHDSSRDRLVEELGQLKTDCR